MFEESVDFSEVRGGAFDRTMIFKHFRASFGANDRFTFLYSNFNCVFFIKQHCFSFYGKFDERE